VTAAQLAWNKVGEKPTMSTILANLFSTILVFMLGVAFFTWSFIYRNPKTTAFWKKTDYFYYLLGVGGIALGLVDG
jgi:hypothetical protein